MYAFVEGKIEECNPAYAVLNCGGIGYQLEISLNTYAKIKDLETVRLLVHQLVREDTHLFYGFFTEEERQLFRFLITVSGVGAATARIILSSLTIEETVKAILDDNARVLQSVKGIGAKTAQRIVLELRDKLSKDPLSEQKTVAPGNKSQEEALSALIMLGFNKNAVEKVLNRLVSTDKDQSVEQLIKQALKLL